MDRKLLTLLALMMACSSSSSTPEGGESTGTSGGSDSSTGEGATTAATTASTGESSTGVATSTGVDTSTGSTDESSESGPGELCGNGEVDDDEVCDDGNDVNGDGCNVDCIASGTLLIDLDHNGPGEGPDVGQDVAVNADGTFIAVGYETGVESNEGIGVWIRKYDEDGTELWTRRYNNLDGGGTDVARHIDIDANGRFVVHGHETRHDIGEGSNYLTRLYDAEGTALWTNTYNSPGDLTDNGFGAGFDADGNVYVAGFEQRFDIGEDYNVRAFKYDPDGNELWSRTYNDVGNGSDQCYDMQLDGDGNVICVGWEVRDDLGEGRNHLIVKWNADGDLQWAKTRHNPSAPSEYLVAVAVGDAGDFVACGREGASIELDDDDIFVGSYDADGNELWVEIVNGDGDGWDTCQAVAIDDDGNILAGGRLTEASGDAGAWLRKYSPSGDEMWTHIQQGADGEVDAHLGIDTYPDGRIATAGYEGHASSGESNNIFVRVFAP